MAGFIYILEHSSGTTVKVGETSVSPERRAADYSRVYQLADFKLAKVFEVPEEARQDIESRAHQKLRKYRISGILGAREIFSCSLSEAVVAVEAAISSSEEFKHWKETEDQRNALEKAIGGAEKERDDALKKLEEEASKWSNQRTVQRSKEKEVLLEDYNRKKYLFLLGGFFLAGWAYTAPGGGPLIGLLVGAVLLWWFFEWSRKRINYADKVLNQKFPIRELSDYPNFSFRQRNINSDHETRIRKIKDSFSIKEQSDEGSGSSTKINVATSSSDVVKKREFTCPTCSAKSNIPLGKAGRVTCPNCQTKTQVDVRGNVKDEASLAEKLVPPNGAGAPTSIDRIAYNEAAKRWSKIKEEHRRRPINNYELQKQSITPSAPTYSPSEEQIATQLRWFKETAEVFERRKANGRVLNQYEQGVINQYQKMLKEAGATLQPSRDFNAVTAQDRIALNEAAQRYARIKEENLKQSKTNGQSRHSESKPPANTQPFANAERTQPLSGLKENSEAHKRKKALVKGISDYVKQKGEKQKPYKTIDEIEKQQPRPAAQPYLPSEEQIAAQHAWLRENAEVFERRKAKGRILNDYEQGLIDRHRALLKEENTKAHISSKAEKNDPEELSNSKNTPQPKQENGQAKENRKSKSEKQRIAVIGLGGCGCNSVEYLSTTEMDQTDWVSVDKWFNEKTTVPSITKITIGPDEPNTDNMKRLAELVSDREHIIFIVGLGGNFGVRMVQEVAAAIKNISGTTVHLIATLPFAFEGAERMKRAETALSRFKSLFGEVVVLKNQDLFALANKDTTFAEAFRLSDEKIAQYIKALK